MLHQKHLFKLFLTILIVMLCVSAASATHGGVEPDTGFEIEGNLKHDGAGVYDWQNAASPPVNLILDPHSKSATDNNTFKPSGKFDAPQNWSILPGSVGSAQAELTNVMAWALNPGDLGGGPLNSWLIMGMERTKKEGTFALDFEFNQNGWDGASGTLVRTTGDIAVGFELKGNPENPETDLQVLIVIFDPMMELNNNVCNVVPGKGNTFTVEKGIGACPAYGASGWYYRFLSDAAILATSGYGVATMNDLAFNVSDGAPAGYTSYDSQGAPDNVVGAFEFAEAAINLTALGSDPGCPGFGTVHAKSRSSLEVGSDLKDLAGPQSLPVKCYIEGYKYLDVNGNGDRDAGEVGLNGWTIFLDNGLSTVTGNHPETGEPGYYRFDDLADGTYVASEDCSNQDPGWVQTEPIALAGCGSGTHTFNINIANRIGIGDFGNGQPSVKLVKTCSSDVFVGDDILYEIKVRNNGNVDLTNIAVNDSLLGNLGTIPYLAAGDKTFFYPTYTTASAGVVTNTATATGYYTSASVTFTDTCATNVYELSVSKDAKTSFTRQFFWMIQKFVDQPGPISVAPGSSVTLNYDVIVNTTGYQDSAWAAKGNIWIYNPAPLTATLSEVVDKVDGLPALVICPSLSIAGGATLTCEYSISLDSGANRTNVAKAKLLNNNGNTTVFKSPDVLVDFGAAEITYIDEQIDVNDTYAGFLGTANVFNDPLPKTFEYPRTVTTDALFCGSITVDNTATFVTNDTGTTGSASVSVIIEVPCQGCTPGFWQGGAGSQLWNEPNDPQWVYGGTNPYIHTTLFNDYFNLIVDARLNGLTMYDLVSSGGTSDSARRAARDMVAAYLNESAFPGAYPADSLLALETMWYNAVSGGDAALDGFHSVVGSWNNPTVGYCPLP